MRPVVAAMGSCRIFRPLDHLAKTGLIVRPNTAASWYTHSTRDALQKLRIVQGHLTLEPHDVPLVVENVAGKWQPSKHGPKFFEGVDVFVAEICSRKIFNRQGVYYQQWCVAGNVNPLSESSAERAREATYRVQSPAEIVSDLEVFTQRAGRPVVFMGHIAVDGMPLKTIAERRFLNDTVRHFCVGSAAAKFFDPNPLIKQNGVQKALVDMNHFANEFHQSIADVLLEGIIASLSSAKV